MKHAYASRLERVREAMEGAGLGALLVTRPASVRWLSGFTSPEDARVLVTGSDAWLLTDGRYVAQAEEESALETIIERAWHGVVASHAGEGAVGIEADHVTLAVANRLGASLGREPVATEGLVTNLRRAKDEEERSAIRRAAALTDRAYADALSALAPGMREVDVALRIEQFVRREGGDGMAFDIIVASGMRSAMPHGLASAKVIEDGDLVTIDMGARVNGYCADMTRTVGIGQVRDAHRALFDAVLEAEIAALAAVAPGAATKDVDKVARDSLDRHGLAGAFSHSLGHGVGLEIHEAPALAPTSSDILEAGMVVTIEPGAYHPGDAGVRVEDLAIVTPDGHEVLSKSPKGWHAVKVPA